MSGLWLTCPVGNLNGSKKDKKLQETLYVWKGKPKPPSTPYISRKSSIVEMTACVPARMKLKDDFGWEGHEAPLKDICFFKSFHLVVTRVEYMDALLGF